MEETNFLDIHTDVLFYLLEFLDEDLWKQYQQALLLSTLCKKMRNILFYRKNNFAPHIFEKYIWGFRCFTSGYHQIVHLDPRSILEELGRNFYAILLFQLRYKKHIEQNINKPDIYPTFGILRDHLYFQDKIISIPRAKNVWFGIHNNLNPVLFSATHPNPPNDRKKYRIGERYQINEKCIEHQNQWFTIVGYYQMHSHGYVIPWVRMDCGRFKSATYWTDKGAVTEHAIDHVIKN